MRLVTELLFKFPVQVRKVISEIIDIILIQILIPGKQIKIKYVFNVYATKNTFADKHYFKGLIFNQKIHIMHIFYGMKILFLIICLPQACFRRKILSDSESELAIRGVFSRLNYIYDDRYFIEFNGRYDVHPNLPKLIFVFFPSLLWHGARII